MKNVKLQLMRSLNKLFRIDGEEKRATEKLFFKKEIYNNKYLNLWEL